MDATGLWICWREAEGVCVQQLPFSATESEENRVLRPQREEEEEEEELLLLLLLLALRSCCGELETKLAWKTEEKY